MTAGDISGVKDALKAFTGTSKKVDDVIDNKVSAYYSARQKEAARNGTQKQ